MSSLTDLDLKSFVREIQDFPKPGILFRDITPLLGAPEAFSRAIRKMAQEFASEKLDAIVAAEARGFIFAAPLALELGVGFVPIRKPGKLPADKHSFNYDLEYGTDTLEMHIDGLEPGARVLVVDDLLATGGTVEACCQLVEQAGAHVVACTFLIELLGLNGADRIRPRRVFALIQYP